MTLVYIIDESVKPWASWIAFTCKYDYTSYVKDDYHPCSGVTARPNGRQTLISF